ncbi:MAG: hypothetical protein JXD21_05495 [Candidatus Omnitrophica bacterium]|nr:hypothetical protein [Candidatus Omnitrophota bacterium]
MIKYIFLFFCIGIFTLSCTPNVSSPPHQVKITREKGSWQLVVDGKPFYIQGAGCGIAKGKHGEDYLKLAQELGANCVRTWGIDQGTQEYFDTAHEYGLKVDAGIWLNHPYGASSISYIGDTSYKQTVRKEALEYVKEFKDHPALLMWNAGNETLFFSRSDEEKVAFCEFLETLVQEIKKIDPYHPVIYTCASYMNVHYLQQYVPSLDAIGLNMYSSIRLAQGIWAFSKPGPDKPYIVTEYGPYIPSDTPKDSNGMPVELNDYQKAALYADYTEQIQSFKGYNLGGFVFHLGETTQESMTWWNLNEGNLKRQSYWEIYRIYTGKEPPYITPRIAGMMISNTSDVEPGEMIDVSVELADGQDLEDLTYEYRLSTTVVGVLQYYVNQYIDMQVEGASDTVRIEAPAQPGIYRLYCFVKDTHGNVSSINKTIKVDE